MGSLEDEILSINAIYSEDTLVILSQNPTICALSLPGESATLRLEFSSLYPDASPSILGTQSVGDRTGKGEGKHIVDLSRDVLAEIYIPGLPCIFDLVEEVGQRLQHLVDSSHQGDEDQQTSERSGLLSASDRSEVLESDELQPLELLDKEPPWIISDAITEKKSVFIARAAQVSSPAEAKSFLHHLLATDKKVAKATHNITAWRIHGDHDTSFQDCDDDGETAAGGRVLHLMQLMDVWNVMVVITRWYGGVQLGPDRFRIINSVARDSLVKGGYVIETGKSVKGDSTKRKGKK